MEDCIADDLQSEEHFIEDHSDRPNIGFAIVLRVS